MSPAERFKRALVSIILELARVYGLTMSLNRDSPDNLVTRVAQAAWITTPLPGAECPTPPGFRRPPRRAPILVGADGRCMFQVRGGFRFAGVMSQGLAGKCTLNLQNYGTWLKAAPAN